MGSRPARTPGRGAPPARGGGSHPQEPSNSLKLVLLWAPTLSHRCENATLQETDDYLRKCARSPQV